MNQTERDLRAYLLICIGALKVLAPKDNAALQGVVSGAEDLLFSETE